MIRHSGPISGVAWGGRGRVATAGYDNHIILWENGESRFRAAHDHLANQCRFSVCGRFLVSASSDHSARVWSATDLKLLSVLRDHDDDVEMAAFDATSERIATASRDYLVRVFDRAGALRLRLKGHAADVISVEWSADGRELISSSDDGTVRRWCAETGRSIAAIDLGGVETDTVVEAAGRLFVGTDEGEIVLLDTDTPRPFKAHSVGVKRLAYDPVGDILVSAGYDRTVKQWRIGGDGSLRLSCETVAPASVWLRSLAFTNDGGLIFGSFGGGYAQCDSLLSEWDTSLVVVTEAINAIHVWEGARWTVGDAGMVKRNGEEVCDLGSLCNFLIGVGRRLLSGGHLGTIYDALSGEPLHRHSSPLNCAALMPTTDGNRIFVGSYTGEVIVFDETDGDLRHVRTVKLHSNAIKGLACNDQNLFSVCANGAAAVHALPDIDSGKVIHRAHDRISNGAAVLPDGRFASVSRDRQLRLWFGTRASVFATPHSHSIKCVAACPRTGLVATGAYNGLVSLFDPRDASWPFTARPTAQGISSIACTGMPGEFVAASYDGRVYRVSVPAVVSVNPRPASR